MKTYEVLEKALALIEDEANWTNRGFAVDRNGRMCAVGACNVIEGLLDRSAESITGVWDSPAAEVLRLLTPQKCVPEFNDTGTHAEVVALFQEAVRNEKAKEGIDVPLISSEPAEPTAVGAEPCLR